MYKHCPEKKDISHDKRHTISAQIQEYLQLRMIYLSDLLLTHSWDVGTLIPNKYKFLTLISNKLSPAMIGSNKLSFY